MWLFTQHGFYSVIVDGANREYVFIQARSTKHLQNLRDKFEVEDQIVHVPYADCPYVLRIKRQRWLSLAADLASDVRYTSFLSAASKQRDRLGPRFVVGLGDLWRAVGEVFRPNKIGAEK